MVYCSVTLSDAFLSSWFVLVLVGDAHLLTIEILTLCLVTTKLNAHFFALVAKLIYLMTLCLVTTRSTFNLCNYHSHVPHPAPYGDMKSVV